MVRQIMEQLLGDLVESPWLLVCSQGGRWGRCCGSPSSIAVRKYLVFTKGRDRAATGLSLWKLKPATRYLWATEPRPPPFPQRVSQHHPEAGLTDQVLTLLL